MYADLDRLALGSYHTDTAADHMRAARQHLESSEVMNGIFGHTESAPNAEVVVRGAQKRHVGTLHGHHQNLTSICEKASGTRRASDSSDKGWLAVQSHEAQNLYVESNRAGAGQTAVVAWRGYDDPTNGLTAVLKAPFVAHHGAAAERAGAILLAQDVNGLAATHQGPPAHVTLVGHSAGAIVVSDTMASGRVHQSVNDVVLVGPVSTDLAHKAADFHLPPADTPMSANHPSTGSRGPPTAIRMS